MVGERELERIYKAVANRKRIAIIRFLKSQNGVTVGDIASAIKLSFKATSRHLQILSAAGFLISEREGINVRYTVQAQSEHVLRVIRMIV